MELFAMGVMALVVTPWMVALWMLGPVVSIALVCATVAAARRRIPAADPAADTLVFRYPSRWRRGSVCFALGLLGAVTGMVVAHPPRDWEDVVYIALSYVMFGSLGGVLLWDVCRFRLEVGPDGFDCRSPWRPHRFIRWAEVVDVSFNSPLGWFEVRATDGRDIRLPALVGALEMFLERCEQRLTPSQLEPALRAYIFLDRPFPGT